MRNLTGIGLPLRRRLRWGSMTTNPAGRTASEERVGSTLAGRYVIDEILGRGGMSTVYRASDSSLGRTVALKVFRGDLADADDLRRQRVEIQLLASLNHPTLVTLFDAVSDDDDRVALVLEYVEGRDLRDELAAGGVDRRTAAMIGADVADALAYIHARGIVHRDLKPGNLLIPVVVPGSTAPRAKLTDFGIARIIDSTHLTSAGSMIGTVGYLSPEQAMGASIGAPSDVYSLGLVLLECLTGSRPFGGTGVEAIAARLSRDPEIPSSLGPAWLDVLARMTRRDPRARLSAAGASLALREIAIAGSDGTNGEDEPAPEAAGDRSAPPAATAPTGTNHPADDLATAVHVAGGDADNSTATATAARHDQTHPFAPGHEEHPESNGSPTTVLPAYRGSDAPTERFDAAGSAASWSKRGSARPAPSPAPAQQPSAPHEAVQLSPAQQPSAPHQPAATTADSWPGMPAPPRDGAPGTKPRAGRRRLVIVAAVIVLFGVGSLIGALVVQGGAERAEVTPVDYPVVEGDLGGHLEQLQRSVEP